MCPDVASRGLHGLGAQTILRAPGQDEVTYLFGSACPLGGEALFEIYSRKRSEEFCLHLEHLEEMFPGYLLFVACDNAPSHQSRDTKLYLLDKQDVLEVVYFPTYSPNLNGMEPIWAFMRGQTTRDVVYETLDDECRAILAWLGDLPLERVVQTLGVLNKVMKAL